MDEFITRQMSLLRQAVEDYRGAQIDLNTLVQRIEGVTSAIDLEPWKEAVFPIIVEIEQINAVTLDLKAELTKADKESIDASLRKLETLIRRFCDT